MKKADKQRLESFAKEVAERVYSVSVSYFEGAEHRKLILGNGHHMAQKLAEMAKKMLLSRAMDSKEKPVDPMAIDCLPRPPEDIQEIRGRCGCRFLNVEGGRLYYERCVEHGGELTWVRDPLADTKGVCKDCPTGVHWLCERRKKKCSCKRKRHIPWWLRLGKSKE